MLAAAHRAIVDAVRAHQSISPAAEWLLDNFHVVDEQIREIADDLPPGFYRILPKLAEGPLVGFPRVFGIAWALTAHTDSTIDILKLTRFVAAYQRVQPLTIGELWAIAITLRVTLVENLRRLAENIVVRLAARRQADAVADQVLGSEAPQDDDAVRQELDQAPWSTAFSVQLAQRLRDRDPNTTPALRWLNEKLAERETSIDLIVLTELQNQSATNVTVRNVITSMRLISTISWPEWFESVSLVDEILGAQSDFAAMDFASRDLYRRAIEGLARRSRHTEIEVARAAIAATQPARDAAAAANLPLDRTCDPGYYLISKGRPAFEAGLAVRTPWGTRLHRANSAGGVWGYVGVVAVVTAAILAWGVAATGRGELSPGLLGLLAILGAIPVSEMAIALVNRLITHSVGATILPGLELREGVPATLATMIVMPTLLSDDSTTFEHIERLEVHYLSNSDDNLYFALVSDWTDADAENCPADEALRTAASDGIARLNRKYGPAPAGDRFLLLHRRRVWDQGEGKWIGWERKRGKLHELNRLLRGATDTTFLSPAGGFAGLPSSIRYVLTLDSDTRMPIGTARRMVGKIAHPLNRARFDAGAGRVVEGHGILQPRVTPSLPLGRGGSLFQRTFSGPNGLDPYAFAVSDVYQDLLGEGSYIGKGIYDIDVIELAMEGRIPNSTVLSHDLLEGIFARAGLTSDIEVVEEFPSRYDVAAARHHRWTRGDWQLLPWIFGRGVTTDKNSPRSAVTGVGRWKLLDNLRRSLAAPAILLALLAGWLMPVPVALGWTAFLLLTIVFSPLLPVVAGLLPRRRGVSLRNHFRGLRDDFKLGLLQSAFLTTFLAHQAWLMADAVGRALYRQFLVRRRMLEWTTSAQAGTAARFDARTLWAQTATSGVVIAAGGAVIVFYGQGAWPIALPFAALWLLSPAIARLASRPPVSASHVPMTAANAKALRMIARRTWRYFEAFVTPEDNMLPPDNFQEDPFPVVAHRTSPTNIGLYLLSVVSARDFGWLNTSDALERLETTLATMVRLERFRGHFYNWYDTRDLHTLEPKYISSVDSGNLGGHLIALSNACKEIAAGKIFALRWFEGLKDVFGLMAESAEIGAGAEALSELLEEFAALLARPAADILVVAAMMRDIHDRTLAATLAAEGMPAGDGELAVWTEALGESLRAHQREFDALYPWAGILSRCPALLSESDALVALAAGPALDRLPHLCEAALLDLRRSRESASAARTELTTALESSRQRSVHMLDRIAALAEAFKAMFDAMDFGFLFDSDRQLLSIGYSGHDGSLDANCYDLLASEARLTSFVAIAKGDLPAKHWFRLGRTLTPIDGGSGLISWSGSMFEYLMPSLVMRAPAGSLLAQTNQLIVRRQIEYGDDLDIPWGMSESQYNVRDIEKTYQYSAFGVPDLGYKRALGENTVVAPYATALAAMVDPAAAVKNFERLRKLGVRGKYGWYEAVDFTASRVPEGATFAILRAYMAHHQAMSLVAIGNALDDGVMRERFHAEPIVQAAELLLQERMPRDVALARPPPAQTTEVPESDERIPEIQRRYGSAHSRVPRTHLLSNGRYSVMMTAAGSGYSRWRDVAITRWREDPTCDGWGSYIFLRDTQTGDVWSAGYQPTRAEPDTYEVRFSEDRGQIIRRDGAIETILDIAISPEEDAEVRRVSIVNHGETDIELDVTSYAEIALARQSDDVAHPAFAKLFVETEFVPALAAIFATRRRRAVTDPEVWAAHLVVVEGETAGEVQFETARGRFMGRGQTVRMPLAVRDGWPLSNTAGPVLDAVFSLRRRVRIARGATACLAFWTMAAPSREALSDLADKHRDAEAFARATTLGWTQAQMQLHHLGISFNDAHLFQRLANHILYSDPVLRPGPEVIKRGVGKASLLWQHGISGDLPIVLVEVKGEDDIGLIRKLQRAHEYWRLKQLSVDLVVINDSPTSYAQDFQDTLSALARANRAAPEFTGTTVRGSIFILRADLISPEVRNLLQAAARATLYGDRGSLGDQINRARDLKAPVKPPFWTAKHTHGIKPALAPSPLEFFNGIGGFASEGREYVTLLEGEARTPAPWINVIANAGFGFQVSTEGGGFTWALNSQQNQLTPWSNDPVGDAPGEILYIRDDETGEIWSATALPIREKECPYLVTHGQGYSRFNHDSHGLALEVLQFVPIDDSIKISRLKITNQSGRKRRISITAYVEWVLGPSRTATAPFVITEVDPLTGAIFAQNSWSSDFSEQVAFADLGGRQTTWTGDRTEFLGRDGTLDRPRGLSSGAAFSNRVGAGLDPCAALQARISLAPGETIEVPFFLGETAGREAAQALVAKYRDADLDAVFSAVTRQWDDIIGKIQVKTPDRALDILLNRWLPYQTLACRVWARTGFYQASGAYGFRDQLQDVMALCVFRPDLTRAHLLRAAGRQFREGDVQHWWLPESGRGIRTHVSDDRIWLPYATAHYLEVTGDYAVLDEMVPFLEGPGVAEGEHDAFFQPETSAHQASLFEHCALALDTSLATGIHGLSLMGTGDWNDGMDRVGAGGKGESVWLAWFLYATLGSFARIAERRAESESTHDWLSHARTLKDNLEQHAWDGDWYRRAYFDDGTPLGSIQNSECRIDSLAQSWSVISGAAERPRAERAMQAVDKYLVKRDEQLVLLFTPPFDRALPDPGYIKSYPGGIRENGGQYTHAAAWAVYAFAKLGDGDKAFELLSLLNPINHASTPAGVERYKVEPYVIAADVYSMPPHVGRGGWTWYTGSAGWTYRVALERVLGFRVQGSALLLDPCIPRAWRGYEISFRHGGSRYEVGVENPLGVCRGILAVKLDGEVLSDKSGRIPLVDDGATHHIKVVLG